MKKEKKIKVKKFTRRDIEEELTEQNIKDIIEVQKNKKKYLKKELANTEDCIAYYKEALK